MPDRLDGFIGVILPQVSETQKRTLAYLKEHSPETLGKIGSSYSCYYSLLTLATGLRFEPQQYYPYNLPFYEALEELDASILLAFSGQYKTATQHLRFVLELVYLGIYLCKPISESWVQKWLLGEEKTPSMTHILNELQNNSGIRSLNVAVDLDLKKECYSIYDSLSSYVHTRGYPVVSANVRGSNLPMLNTEALEDWADFLHSVVRVMALGMIGRFPQALQRVPVFEKMGFAHAPRGGFLEPFEVDAIERMFDVNTLSKLRLYSDKHHTEIVRIDRERIQRVPDLTLEELRASLDQWWETMKQLDQGDIPGKTWYVGFATSQTQEDSETTLETASTPQEFIKIATHLRRQMDATDELMLAQVYTEDLFRKKSFFDSINANLSSKAVQLLRGIYDWAKDSAYRVWWNTSESGIPFFSFQYRSGDYIFSVFTVLQVGYLLLNYDHIATAVGQETLAAFHQNLRAIQPFNFMHEDTDYNPTLTIEDVARSGADAISRFKKAVEDLGGQLDLQQRELKSL